MRVVNELLIASVTPQNLERGVLWFEDHAQDIKKSTGTNPWWRENILIVSEGFAIKPSELVRRVMDMGYERTQSVVGKGLVRVSGGIIEIWPVNTGSAHVIEFTGNTITALEEVTRQERVPVTSVLKLNARQAIEKLPVGSFVVHADHGIGVFKGVETPPRVERKAYYAIAYAPARINGAPDILYVPTDQRDRLSPYVGFETPRVHRLGGTLWERTKRKVKEDTEKLARELLALYAKRHHAKRPGFFGDRAWEEEFRARFPYAETEDQLIAEAEIMKDLERGEPMDRVLAGDVGFGKTEIAIRAAFRVIASGKQVAFLAPTTVLAEQHRRTLTERFGDLPVSSGMLSRLVAPHEQKRIIRGLTNGTIDCVVGTHRLLSQDVAFKNLGLVIIDEEQRFGVKQKEKFKNMRTEVDMLSLSATPIPRTLELTLTHLRDVSFLRSPPPDRLAIHTYVLPYAQKTVCSALARELSRGGQIYFLHNRIGTIGTVQERLEKIITRLSATSYGHGKSLTVDHGTSRTPPLIKKRPRIGVMHGRMKEKEMISVMRDFREKKIDILLATTIIENGLDISSANTLIVDDATLIGLSEAHQLRGRVGRGSTQACAYFLFRPRRLTEKALHRLQALQDYAGLGAGYNLALRDLEIRGAGNILGREQSGAANKIGLNLYYHMLAEAIEEIKAENK